MINTISYNQKKTYSIFIIMVSFLMLNLSNVSGQACCSGGVPISNNIGIRPVDVKQITIRGLYDANFLNSFYNGSDKLDDASVKRLSQTFFLQGIYGVSDRISFNAMFSYVFHKRTVINSISSDSVSTNSGLGDALFLIQYQFLRFKTSSFYLTIGPKIPIGKSDLRDENDILLPADLQPGTSSWDAIAGTGYVKTNFIRPTMNLTMTLVSKFNSYSDRYNGSQQYKYGNDYQFLFGLTDSFFIGKLILNPGILMRFWHTSSDKVDGNDFPNTGGSWVFLVPSVNFAINQRFSTFISFEIPVYQNLNGTQLSTNLRISGGVQISFSPTKKKILGSF